METRENASPTPEVTHPPRTLGAGLTVRAVSVGLITAALTVVLVSYAELVSGQIMLGYLQAPPAAIFLLFVVTIANSLYHRLDPKRALSTSEMATIYAMTVPAAMIASHGMLQRILPVMVAGNYFASPANGWITTYFPHTPHWLVIWDPAGPPKPTQVVEFFEKLPRGKSVPWQVWLMPLAAWLLLFALVYGVFLAMATILRKQWVENERLSFPLIQLPVELISGQNPSSIDSPAGGFLTSKPAWLGFTVPFLVFTINGLHHNYPDVPFIPLTLQLNSYITTPPWNGISILLLNFSFAALGFFFLLPTELLFSLWFFYLLGKCEEVAFTATGHILPVSLHANGLMMIGAQTEGAWIALVIVYLTLAKSHLKNVWNAVWSNEAKNRGDGEMISYRAAFWLLVGCSAGIVAWCCAAGMSAWLAVWVFGLYLFVQAIVMARSTAEAGLIMTEGCWTPSDVLSLGMPLHALGASNLTILSYVDATFTRDLRGIMLTAFLDMQKLADLAGLRLRALKSALIMSIVCAVVIGCVLQIWLPYHNGGNSTYNYMYSNNSIVFFNEYYSATKPGPAPPSLGAPWYAISGCVIALGLGLLRARLSWWPLHPLGYALMGSWTIVVFWLSILIAWIVKANVLRYGGMRLYRQVRPLFIGMILGELSAAAVWTIISLLTKATSPQFPWP